MGGGSNNLFRVVTNPVSLVLKDKQSFWFDPIGSTLTQGVINWGNLLTGKEKFGQHKDWWGTGENGLGNKQMRRWTEGKNYKKWETWKQEQAVEYEKQYAELREKNNPKPKTPADTPLVRRAAPQKTTLLDDEVYPPTSYLT